MLLTDEEISDLWVTELDDRETVSAFARAIEAAILAKLASAEFPEPVAARWPSVPGSHHYAGAGGCGHGAFGEESEDLFTADQLTAWGNTRYAQGAAAQLAHEPEWYAYRTNGAHWFCFQDKPPEDSYDEGTLKPLYTRREA